MSKNNFNKYLGGCLFLAIFCTATSPSFAALQAGVGGIGAPLQTKIAKTLPQKQMLLFTQNNLLKYSPNNSIDPSYDLFSDTNFGMSVGINDNLMLTLTTAAAFRSGNIGGKEKETRGLGDTNAWLQWRIKDAAEANTVNNWDIALLLGVRFPTGESRRRTREGELFPRQMQLGKSSVDTSSGIAFTKDEDYYDFSFSALYTFTARDNGYEFGNQLELSSRIALNIVDQPGATVSSLNLIGEATFLDTDKDVENGTLLNNTGGKTIYVSAGVSAVFADHFSLAFLLQAPVYQHKYDAESQQNRYFRSVLMAGFTF